MPIDSLIDKDDVIIMPPKFTVNKARVFATLADDKGHANKDLIKELGQDKSNMSRLLQGMMVDELIYQGPKQPTFDSESKKRLGKKDPFFIRNDGRVYSSFIDFVVINCEKELFAEFLGSDHMNKVIAEKGFLFAYDLVKEKLKYSEIKNIASRELFSLPETAKYYEIYNMLGEHPERVDDKFKELFEPPIDDPLLPYEEDFKVEFEFLYSYDDSEPAGEVFPNNRGIKILAKFDILPSVEFYRTNIFKFFQEYYERLEVEGKISPGYRKYLEQDNFLSPLTSYPVNNSLHLIFSPPFQRIYDDVFLLNAQDIEMFVLRARAIYENFEDILLERNKELFSDDYILNLDAKIFIYHWNVAITRFDRILDYVAYFYDLLGDKKIHLKSEGNRFYIVDLETNTNTNLLPPLAESDTLLYGILPTHVDSPGESPSLKIMDDPFGYLRPSKYFPPDIIDKASEMTLDRISSNLMSKYEEIWKWLA